MTRFGICSLLALFSFSGLALGDVPSDAPQSLKNAYEALGRMGLSLEQAKIKMIEGNYRVTVPDSAILEENGKTFVVVLDERNPENSEKREILAGQKSGNLVHVKTRVSPGEYVVVRKATLIAEARKPEPVVSEENVYQPSVAPAKNPILSRSDERYYVSARPVEEQEEIVQPHPFGDIRNTFENFGEGYDNLKYTDASSRGGSIFKSGIR